MNVMFTRVTARRAGVSQVNPHRFRHTFATWAIRVNARELDVQYWFCQNSGLSRHGGKLTQKLGPG